jgi:hypothetical protein
MAETDFFPTLLAAEQKDLEPTKKTKGSDGSSLPGVGDNKNPGHVNNCKVGDKNDLIKIKDADRIFPGFSKTGGPQGKVKDPKANAQDETKKKQEEANKGKFTAPSGKTAASQDPSKNIHDALMAADPGQVSASLKKALQSMIMLKMMDKVTSPAGLLAMAGGGLGGALAGIAGSVGMGGLQNALNGAIGGIVTGGLINGNLKNALQDGMIGMVTGTAVGALHQNEIYRAVDTAVTIRDAMGEINRSSPYAVDAVASFGGPSFGLVPGSLESKIALVGPGGRLQNVQIINGVRVTTTVITSVDTMDYHRIPVLNGMEHVAIAADSIANLADGIAGLLGVDNPIGNAFTAAADALTDVADVASVAGGLSRNVNALMGRGVNGLSSTATNVLAVSVGANALAGMLNGGMDNIISGGLNKILGCGLDGLLGNANSLLPPGIGGLVGQAMSGFSLPSVSAFGVNTGDIQSGMIQHTKNLALHTAAASAAKNIFGKSQAESIAGMVGAAANIAAQVGSYKMVTPFGDTIHAVAAGIAIGETVGSAIGTIVQGAGARLLNG